jgi:hypothetical protein
MEVVERFPTFKDMTRKDRRVQFVAYMDGLFWYKTWGNFLFPVKLEELPRGMTRAYEKAEVFLGQIAKQMDSPTKIPAYLEAASQNLIG